MANIRIDPKRPSFLAARKKAVEANTVNVWNRIWTNVLSNNILSGPNMLKSSCRYKQCHDVLCQILSSFCIQQFDDAKVNAMNRLEIFQSVCNTKLTIFLYNLIIEGALAKRVSSPLR